MVGSVSEIYGPPAISNTSTIFPECFVTETSEPPTPHYNSSVLGDLLPRAHLQFLSAVSSQCSAFADGVALLKVWLRQRELDRVTILKLLNHLHKVLFLLFTKYFLLCSSHIYVILLLFCRALVVLMASWLLCCWVIC